jgi:hypothetical protein
LIFPSLSVISTSTTFAATDHNWALIFCTGSTGFSTSEILCLSLPQADNKNKTAAQTPLFTFLTVKISLNF